MQDNSLLSISVISNMNGKWYVLNKLSVGYNSFRNNLSATYRLFASIPINSGLQSTTDINDINSQIMSDAENGLIFEREESNVSYKQKLDQTRNFAEPKTI